jgi:protein gp37
MGENSGISWTKHTFNPWWGCSERSPACDHCYARETAARYGWTWGDNAEKRTFGPKHWAEPLKWNRKAEAAGEVHNVFCASMADVLDQYGPGSERLKLWKLVEATPALQWLILTKRPEFAATMIPQDIRERIWLGITAENQRYFDIRWRFVQQVWAKLYFVSYEPALGPLDLPADFLELGKRAWVIAGGESGRKARPWHPDWIRRIRDQCREAGVAFHLKQFGAWRPSQTPRETTQRQIWVAPDGTHRPAHEGPVDRDAVAMEYVHKGQHATPVLDGRSIQEVPSHV